MQSSDLSRILLVIPTYNEAANLGDTVGKFLAIDPRIDILVVDDNSPDGTGQLASRMSLENSRIKVLLRPEKAGLGRAYLAGFDFGLAAGYQVLGEVDADGSHQASDLPKLLAALAEADLVIGSRWIPGGGILNWSKRRELLSRWGNRYARLLLGIKVNDITAGYRLYRSVALEKLDLESVESHGYAFQADLTYRCLQQGLTVVEVPITFIDRVKGESKMSPKIAVESLKLITSWAVTSRLGKTGKR